MARRSNPAIQFELAADLATKLACLGEAQDLPGFRANRGRGGRSVRTRWAFSKVMDQMGEGRLMRIARFFRAPQL